MLKNKAREVKSVFESATFRQSGLTIVATIINGLLGMAFYPLIARLTGVSDFGVFSISILVTTLFADIANFGTDTGIVRFVGKYRSSDLTRANKYLKFALKLKLAVGIIIATIGMFIVPFIAINILGKAEFIFPLRIAILGSSIMLLYSFTTSALQSMEKFRTWSGLSIAMNALRLLIAILIAVTGLFTLQNILFVYILVPLIGFLVGLFVLPAFWKVEKENTIAKEFLHYNKWVAAFICVAALSSRVDSLLTARFLSLESVGIYAAAVSLASIGSQIVAAIATVVAPKLASFESKAILINYFKKLQLFLIVFGIFILIFGSLTAVISIPLLFGQEFIYSIRPFIILLLSQVIFLISIPVHTTIIYYYGKPKIFVLVGLVHLAIIYFLGIYFINLYEYVGAAIAVLIGNLSNLILPAVWLAYSLKHDNN